MKCDFVDKVTLRDLAVDGPEDFYRRFRGQRESVLVCPVDGTGCASLIFSAPLDRYFASIGLERTPSLALSVGELSRELHTDDDFCNRFFSAVEEARIKIDYFPIGLFSPFDRFGRYGGNGSVGPLGRRFDGFAWSYRVFSAFIPEQDIDPVLDWFLEQGKQFRDLAYLDVPEEIDEIIRSPGFSEMPSNSKVVYESPDFAAFAATAGMPDSVKERVLARVEEITAGAPPRLFPLHLLKTSPNMFLSTYSSRLDVRIVEARARMLRTLEWPWHYGAAENWLGKLHSVQAEVEFTSEDKSLIASACSELQEFIEKCRNSYPVIERRVTVRDLLPRATVR